MPCQIVWMFFTIFMSSHCYNAHEEYLSNISKFSVKTFVNFQYRSTVFLKPII